MTRDHTAVERWRFDHAQQDLVSCKADVARLTAALLRLGSHIPLSTSDEPHAELLARIDFARAAVSASVRVEGGNDGR